MLVSQNSSNIIESLRESIKNDHDDEMLVNVISNNMEEYRKQIPRLYRYSSADYYNIRGLETNSLYLNPNGKMNDIFEGLSCEITDDVLRALDKLEDIAFLKSFSEKPNDLLMWGYYADGYSGMCVEYDLSKLSDEVLVHLLPVFYSDERIEYTELDRTIEELKELKRTNDDDCYPNYTEGLINIMHLFLRKPRIWEHEKEWRIVATYPQIYNSAEDMDDTEILYGIDNRIINVSGCVKKVFLGPRMKTDIKEHVTQICDKNVVEVHSLKLSKGAYGLECDG